MHIKTILNRIQKFKSFVYGKAQFLEEAGTVILLVEIRPRRRSKPVCAWCRQAGPGR